jgi:hypothetical protein
VFGQEELELALHALPGQLEEAGPAVSCLLLIGINSFFHAARAATGSGHRAHVGRLVASATAVARQAGLRLLYTEQRLFGREEEGPVGQVVIQQREDGLGHTVTLEGRPVRFTVGDEGDLSWMDGD